MARIVALHGVATTAAIWTRFASLLPEHEVVALERPRTGSLSAELSWLRPHVEGAFVVGLSGGATLGLALTGTDVRLVGAVLHEPAVGSLLPGLLTPMRAAFVHGGTAAFGSLLYGEAWSPALAGPLRDAITLREIEMFAGFEPAAPSPGQGPVLVTYGAESPPVRAQAAEALRSAFGYDIRRLPGTGHFVTHHNPEALAATVRSLLPEP